jgi:sugar-specific transcriptional regulator TrmB
MSILEDIGLTKRESEIYQEVLRRGEVKIGTLLVSLKMHPQVIYRAIEGLSEKGLVSEFYRRGRKHVRASSPNRLLKLEEKRFSRLEEYLPSLIAMHKRGQKETIVRVEKGAEAIVRMRVGVVDTLKKGDVYYLIGGSTERFYDVMGKELERTEERRVKKRIKRKIISYESQRSRMQTIDKEKSFTDFRFIDGDKTSPASTAIFGDTVGLMIWSEEPIAITLQSKELADSYRDFFESLWKIAKK